MKRFFYHGLIAFVVFVALCLVSGKLYAGPIMTGSITGEAGTAQFVAFPAKSGKFPVLNYLSVLATVSSADVVVYGADATQVTYASAGAKAAGATTFEVSTCVGMDDSDVVVVQWQGGTVEADVMASCVETTGLMTITDGLVNAITSTQAGNNLITVQEMQALVSYANVGSAGRVSWGPGPLLTGAEGGEFAVGFTGTGAVEVVTIDYR